MKIVEWILFTLLGLGGVWYAILSEHVSFALTDHLPGALGNRKVTFLLGLMVLLLGFGSAYWIHGHHGFITAPAAWLILLGSTPWFTKRAVRKFFDPSELKVIRTSLVTGLLVTVLSAGFLGFPPQFSPGTFLMGIALMIPAGRLWWNQDPTLQNQTMVFSKRDYS